MCVEVDEACVYDSSVVACVLLTVYTVSHCSVDLPVGAFLRIMASKAANALLYYW